MPHYLERVVSFTYVCYCIRSIGESERRMDGCFNWIRPDARLAVVIQMQAYVFTTLWKHRSVVSGVLAGWMSRVLRVRLPRSTFSNPWPARQMFIWFGRRHAVSRPDRIAQPSARWCPPYLYPNLSFSPPSGRCLPLDRYSLEPVNN